MTTCSDAYITFTVGRYEGDAMTWREASTGPIAVISSERFRTIFDAVGEQTVDTTDDIGPTVLLGAVGRPRGSDGEIAELRLVCHWARSLGARVGFELDEPAGAV